MICFSPRSVVHVFWVICRKSLFPQNRKSQPKCTRLPSTKQSVVCNTCYDIPRARLVSIRFSNGLHRLKFNVFHQLDVRARAAVTISSQNPHVFIYVRLCARLHYRLNALYFFICYKGVSRLVTE